MEFDSNIEKHDVHNVAYNSQSNTLDTFPVSKITLEDTEYISISLHKWTTPEGVNKGSYIAFIKLCNANADVIKDSIISQVTILKNIFAEYNSQLFTFIEDGNTNDIPLDIVYFRWSVNVWRNVAKPKKKWIFIGNKPSKDNPCQIKRLLHS